MDYYRLRRMSNKLKVSYHPFIGHKFKSCCQAAGVAYSVTKEAVAEFKPDGTMSCNTASVF